MAIRLEFAPGRVTAFLEGEIDHHNAAALRECIDEAVEQHRPETLRINFGGVSFMDSSGVGLVMGRISVMRVLGGRVEVINLTPQAYKVMQLASLDKIATIRQQAAPQKQASAPKKPASSPQKTSASQRKDGQKHEGE